MINYFGYTAKYVDKANGSDSNNGTTWALAYKTLDKVFSVIGAGAPYGTNTVFFFASGAYSLTSNTVIGNRQLGDASCNIAFHGCGYVAFVGTNTPNTCEWSNITSGAIYFRNISFLNFAGFIWSWTACGASTTVEFGNCNIKGPVAYVSTNISRSVSIPVKFYNCVVDGGGAASMAAVDLATVSDTSVIRQPAAYDTAHVKGPGTTPWFLFYRGTSSKFQLNPIAQCRVNVDLTTARTITLLTVGNGSSLVDTTTFIKTFKVQGSNASGSFASTTFADDTGWTDLTGILTTLQPTSTNGNGFVDYDRQAFVIANTTPYQYYSIKAYSNWGSASYYEGMNFNLYDTVNALANTPVIPKRGDSSLSYFVSGTDIMGQEVTNYLVPQQYQLDTLNGTSLIPVNYTYYVSASGTYATQVATPSLTRIEDSNTNAVYFPALSQGWENDTTYTSGTAAIDDTLGITINTGNSCRAFSPVFDFGQPANITGLSLIASEDISRPTGQNQVIDSTPYDTTRTIEYRVSSAQFYPSTSTGSVPWISYQRGTNPNLYAQYLQVRVTLNRNAA